MTNENDALQETAARGVEAIHIIVKQRDQLLAESERMRADLALALQRCQQLEGRLATATGERDHYMRFATELTVKLSGIQMMIESCIDGAKQQAYKPSRVPLPKAIQTKTVPPANALTDVPPSMQMMLDRVNGALQEDGEQKE
jgi:hypothetical protein